MLPLFQDTVERASRVTAYSATSFIRSMQLRDALKARVSSGLQELDMAAWMGRTALEVIGQGGLGYSFDSFMDDKKDGLTESLKLLL